MYHSIQESVVRVYDVGRRRDDEDDQVILNVFCFLVIIIFIKFFPGLYYLNFRKKKMMKMTWMVLKMEVVLILVQMIMMVCFYFKIMYACYLMYNINSYSF